MVLASCLFGFIGEERKESRTWMIGVFQARSDVVCLKHHEIVGGLVFYWHERQREEGEKSYCIWYSGSQDEGEEEEEALMYLRRCGTRPPACL